MVLRWAGVALATVASVAYIRGLAAGPASASPVRFVLAAIASGCIKSVVKSVSRERTRREIAAYIAEGTMTPEQGEKLLAAGHKQNGCG